MIEPQTLPVPAAIKKFAWLLLAVSMALTGGGYLLVGIDFTLGVLLGSSLVGLNFLWSQRIFRRALRDPSLKTRLAVSFLLKFAITALVLFVAVLKFQMDPIGILVGVSSLFLAGLLYGIFRFGI